MSAEIQMGNDEFILYIRKNYPTCSRTNDDLGRRIWAWIGESDTNAEKAGNGDPVPCFWGDTAANIAETRLPLTATQFKFSRSLLPSLYDRLDKIGSE